MVATAPDSRGPQALVSMGIPAFQTETLPLPILPLLNIPLISTPPVGCSLVWFLTDPQYTKWDHSPNGASNDHQGRRSQAETTEAKVSSGHSTPKGNGEPLKHHRRCPTMVWVPPGVLKSTTARTTPITVAMSQPQDKLRENAANSDLEEDSGDCLTCSDMEEVAVRTAQKRFWKKVQTFCSIARGCLWSEAPSKVSKG